MNTPILITGCQRSGTTLLSLILDSHPDITAIDEMHFNGNQLGAYLNHPDFHPFVAFKLPAAAHEAGAFKQLPNIKVLWCLRDPRDVVLSMCRLVLKAQDGAAEPWSSHPLGAPKEIKNCLGLLQEKLTHDLPQHLNEFQQVLHKPTDTWTKSEHIFVAALCWRLKQELLAVYDQEQIDYLVVQYEKLIAEPKDYIGSLLEYVGAPWHDDVLKHHQVHSGTSVGATDNTRAIDSRNTNKWRQEFSEEELAIISSVCKNSAARFGYSL